MTRTKSHNKQKKQSLTAKNSIVNVENVGNFQQKAPSDEGAGCTKCRLGERILPLIQKSNGFLTAPLTRGAFFLRNSNIAALIVPLAI